LTRPGIRRAALALAALAPTLVLGAGGGSAVAQVPAGPVPRLVSQTPWVADDQPFSLSFAYAGGLPADGTIELTLYGPVAARETIVRGAADPTLLGDIRDVVSIPTAIVPEGPNGAFRLRLATDGADVGLPVADPGVYPLSLAVAEADGTEGRSLLTFVVRPPDDAALTPLRVAVVLPLHAVPSLQPDGAVSLGERPRRVLDVRARLLDRYEDVPLTVAATPELLAAAALEDPRLLNRVRTAVASRHVVTSPYVRLDLAAFSGVPTLTKTLEEQFAAGRRTLRRTLRRTTDSRTWVGPGNPTTAALDALDRAGSDRALFREESVTGPVTIDEPVVVRGADGQTIDAVLADARLRAYVNGTADPVLMAHRTIADLALLAAPSDDGGVATHESGAGVVVELPANRPLPAAYLDTLLAGLATNGPLRPVSLAAIFDEDPPGNPGTEPGPVVEGIPLAGQDLTAYGRNLEATEATVDGYTSFAGPTDPLNADLRRRLLVSGAIDLTELRRGQYLRSVSQAIQAQTAGVTITDDETITLTSREGDIPITLHNETGRPVDVELTFDSDNKLDFPDGSSQRLRLSVGANRVEVPVEARASGSFPLRITATSPDGALTVSRAQITVRSTAVSGVGVVLSIGALLVLVVWWARHWRTARRNRRLVDPEDLDPVGRGNAEVPAPV
jgi:hypothetical protein